MPSSSMSCVNVQPYWGFEVLHDGKRVIGDTYNKNGWYQKLNIEYEELMKEVFGKAATCRFTFSFDYIKSSNAIDDFTDISTFNAYLNRELEGKNERNDELKLIVRPGKNYDHVSSPVEIDKILEHFNNIEINYGRIVFSFDDFGKSYNYME
jgi:hypothetical protein